MSRLSTWNHLRPSFQFQKLQKTSFEEAQAVRGQFQAPQAAPFLEDPLTGYSILYIALLTFLSTNVQSLEPSIEGSTKFGLTEFDFFIPFTHTIPDSILQ
jgi:hypothetical protein